MDVLLGFRALVLVRAVLAELTRPTVEAPDPRRALVPVLRQTVGRAKAHDLLAKVWVYAARALRTP